MQGEQEYFFSFYPLQLFLSLTKQVLRHNHSMKFLLKNDEIVTIENFDFFTMMIISWYVY